MSLAQLLHPETEDTDETVEAVEVSLRAREAALSFLRLLSSILGHEVNGHGPNIQCDMPGVPDPEQETNNADQAHGEDEAPPYEGHGLDTGLTFLFLIF